MRFTTFLGILCLFPVLISGRPATSRRDDSSSSVTETDPLAMNLITSTFLFSEAFYAAALDLSTSLGDTETTALLAAAGVVNRNDFDRFDKSSAPNCTFDFSSLLDQTNSKNLIASILHVEQMKGMGLSALLKNNSISVSPADQASINFVLGDASDLVLFTGNVSAPGISMGAQPAISLTDYVNFFDPYKPVCDPPIGLGVIVPFSEFFTFRTPYIVESHGNFAIANELTGCPDRNAQAFCQMIGPDPSVPATVTLAPNCTADEPSVGTSLWYITSTSDPLPTDPEQRVLQQDRICVGPQLFVRL